MSEKNLALPGNPRYQPKELIPFFGYDNLYQGIAKAEVASLEVLIEIGVIPPKVARLLTENVKQRLLAITTTQVDKVERTITKHDIRAWVYLAKQVVPKPLRSWIHILLTSYDVIDSGRILMFKQAHEQVIQPAVSNVLRTIGGMVRKNLHTKQIGRTHGQHALPITVGFWLATILNRLHDAYWKMNQSADKLVGKISGAVGAYNAQSALDINELCKQFDGTFEELVLKKISLKPAAISTQIVPPEPLADYLFSCLKTSAILAQFARDCRHLMRTEIGEVTEYFDTHQAGSSTMAHKRNPISFENLEGTFLKSKNEFGKVLDTLISDHQRDLVGSSIMRDFPTIVVNLMIQLNTLLKEKDGKNFLQRISFHEESLQKNLAMQADVILAEPLYIALQIAGLSDAHELVNHTLVPLAQTKKISLKKAVNIHARKDKKFAAIWKKIPKEFKEKFNDPQAYIGEAPDKALEIVNLVPNYFV